MMNQRSRFERLHWQDRAAGLHVRSLRRNSHSTLNHHHYVDRDEGHTDYLSKEGKKPGAGSIGGDSSVTRANRAET
jgi:hypothetical protein